MNENLYALFDEVLISSFDIKNEGNKAVLELGGDAEYGNLETYSIFPGIILSNSSTIQFWKTFVLEGKMQQMRG